MTIRSLVGASVGTNQSRFSILSANPGMLNGAMESIATVSVGSGGASTPEFTNIPGTYQHLQIRISGRGTTANNRAAILLRFNGDTGSNYASHYLLGNGSAASAGGAASQSSAIYSSIIPLDGALSSQFGANVIDVLDYANTSKYKTVRSITGSDNNGTGSTDTDKGFVQVASSLWMSTSAVTSISFALNGAPDWKQYSIIALYGIRS